MNDRILITGSGVISAIGNGKKETLDALLTNRSGIGRMEYVGSDLTRLPVGEVKMSDDELKSMLSVGDDSPVVRTTLLGIAALREALADAGIGDTRDVAFISGTTVGGMDRTERFYSDALEGKGPADLLATHDCGSCTADIAARCGGFAFVTTPSTACSSAMNAIILGCRLIRSGIYDIVVAGGAECLTRYHLDGFHSLMILDENPCRPFDKDRAGLNLGRGLPMWYWRVSRRPVAAVSLLRLSSPDTAMPATRSIRRLRARMAKGLSWRCRGLSECRASRLISYSMSMLTARRHLITTLRRVVRCGGCSERIFLSCRVRRLSRDILRVPRGVSRR